MCACQGLIVLKHLMTLVERILDQRELVLPLLLHESKIFRSENGKTEEKRETLMYSIGRRDYKVISHYCAHLRSSICNPLCWAIVSSGVCLSVSLIDRLFNLMHI